jgi:hypothetical protein
MTPMPDIPEPRRSGSTYVCQQRTGPNFEGDRCNRPFIFRKSYRTHWLLAHGPKEPIDEIPEPEMQGQRILGSWVDEAQRMPTLVEIRVDGPTNLLHYPPSPHMTGPGCRCSPTEIDSIPDHLPTITTRGLGNGVAAAQPQLAALSADPRVQPWTEVDRKNAAARLDTYLEQTERPHVALSSASFEVTTKDPVVIGILTGAHAWNEDAHEYQLAHHVKVIPVTGTFIEDSQYHVCTVCELVTIDPPPLPCPGPRKDT